MTPDKTHSDALAPCPFCGAPAHGYAIEPHSHSPAVLRLVPELPDHPGSYVIEGQCACGSGLIGANEAEVVARWNTRWGSPVVAGEPKRVFIVATGEEHKGEETYTRYDASPPPLCDSECLYTTPQPTQPQAGAVPLTDEQIKDLQDDDVFFGTCRQIVRAIEAAHGIKEGGQHAE